MFILRSLGGIGERDVEKGLEKLKSILEKWLILPRHLKHFMRGPSPVNDLILKAEYEEPPDIVKVYRFHNDKRVVVFSIDSPVTVILLSSKYRWGEERV